MIQTLRHLKSEISIRINKDDENEYLLALVSYVNQVRDDIEVFARNIFPDLQVFVAVLLEPEHNKYLERFNKFKTNISSLIIEDEINMLVLKLSNISKTFMNLPSGFFGFLWFKPKVITFNEEKLLKSINDQWKEFDKIDSKNTQEASKLINELYSTLESLLTIVKW